MLAFFPVKITHILTDNGLKFTTRLLKSEIGIACQKDSKIDLKYIQNKIQHQLTAPFTPKTNAMVERVNGTIKNNTIKNPISISSKNEKRFKHFYCPTNLTEDMAR